jgi:hypothetical protein
MSTSMNDIRCIACIHRKEALPFSVKTGRVEKSPEETDTRVSLNLLIVAPVFPKSLGFHVLAAVWYRQPLVSAQEREIPGCA